jgi:DNA-binding transcriptional MerR regulator
MTYAAGTFARLVGVTVKALRHYERRALLTPRRNARGYRRYSLRDLQQLEHILALKSLGLPLAEIAALVQPDATRAAAALRPSTLRAHRERLVAARANLDRAIAAIDEVVGAPEPAGALRRFVIESSWDRWEARRRAAADGTPRAPDRASPSRLALFHEIGAAMDCGVSDAPARELVARWRALAEREADGDAATLAATKRVWDSRKMWPTGVSTYIASLYDLDPVRWEQIADFIDRWG